MCVPDFMAIRPDGEETFHAKPQMSTLWWRLSHQTNNVCAQFHLQAIEPASQDSC